jgi:hypothetical protein
MSDQFEGGSMLERAEMSEVGMMFGRGGELKVVS